jgi:hypothetical protein
MRIRGTSHETISARKHILEPMRKLSVAMAQEDRRLSDVDTLRRSYKARRNASGAALALSGLVSRAALSSTRGEGAIGQPAHDCTASTFQALRNSDKSSTD